MSKARHSRGIEKSVTQFLNSQLKTYTYNQNQRLIRVTDTGNVLGEYIYNGNGQRSDKLIPSQNKCTVFHYDQNGLLITESTRTGNIKAEYVYLNEQPLAKIENNNIYYYHNDHLGTPMIMTNSSGTKVWDGEFLPFGESLSVTGSVTNNLRFPGQYFDSETALNYNWFRYYDSKLGRYPQADPIGLLGGVNLFTYVRNSPCNWADPWGLKIVVIGNMSDYQQAVTYLSRDPGMSTIIHNLEVSSTIYTVILNSVGDDSYVPATQTINWDPNSALKCTGGGKQSPALGLGHEMAHADAPWYWRLIGGIPWPDYDYLEERRVIVGPETAAAQTLGEGIRTNHRGTPYWVPNPISR